MSSVSSRPPDPRPRADLRQLALRDSLTDLTTGIPILCENLDDWADELVAAGLERRVAYRLILVTVAFEAMRAMPLFLHSAAEHVGVALADLDTFEAVRVALVEPDLEELWAALATETEAPVSGRCRLLATLCRRKGLQVVAP